MTLSVNGHSQVPPGFRFHPTEEELLHYYLRKKVAFQKIDLDVIRDVDLNKLEPWDIQGLFFMEFLVSSHCLLGFLFCVYMFLFWVFFFFCREMQDWIHPTERLVLL